MSYPYGGDQLYPPPPERISGNPADAADRAYPQDPRSEYPYQPQNYPQYPTYYATYPTTYPPSNMGPPDSVPPAAQPQMNRFEEISIEQKLPPPQQPGASPAPGARASFTDNSDDHCMCLQLGAFVLGFFFPLVWLIAAVVPCCLPDKLKGAAMWLWIGNSFMGTVVLIVSLLLTITFNVDILR